MTNALGVWTADDCALVLIDYQKEMFEVIRSETRADLVEMHVRLLAKTAKAFDVPIVLTTVGVGAGFNGPTLPSILSEVDGIEPIDRTSMNAFEDEARARLGDYFAEVLLLDQGTDAARARAEFGWRPSHPGLVDEFRNGSYRKQATNA